MSELTKKYIEELDQGIRSLFTSRKWQDYLIFLSRFHAYSVNNTLAIYVQRPDASLVASFSDWRKRGRYVKRGEKGIQIIAPHTYKVEDPDTGEEKQFLGFHLAYCFDISQTDGDELPESPCRTLDAVVDGYIQLRDALCAISPAPVTYAHIDGNANGYYELDECCIVVSDSLPEMQSIKTTIHEIAHAWLHSRGGDEEKVNQRTREVQAESVAYTVCRYLGLDTSDYSFGYIASWSKKQSLDELKASIGAITRTADQIIKDLEDFWKGATNADIA